MTWLILCIVLIAGFCLCLKKDWENGYGICLTLIICFFIFFIGFSVNGLTDYAYLKK